MAAGITPGEAGLILKPNAELTKWARENHQRQLLGETALTYQEYSRQQQGEQQWQQQ